MATFQKQYDKKNKLTGVRAVAWYKDKAGKVHRPSRVCKTNKEAKAWARAKELELEQADGVDHGVTVGDALQRFIDEVIPEKNYKTPRMEGRFRALLRYSIADKQVALLTVQDGYDHVREVRERPLQGGKKGKPKPSTIIYEMNLLIHVIKCCEHWYKIPYPWTGVDFSLDKAKARSYLISQKDRDTLRRSVRLKDGEIATTLYQRVYLAFEFAIATGMRAGEIASITQEDINTTSGMNMVHLTKTKNGDTRDVPLTKAALDILALLPNVDTGKQLFGFRHGTHITQCFADLKVRTYLPNSEKGGFSFHDSRHLFCTNTALIPGMTPMMLARIIGHKTLNMLMVYFDPSAAMIGKMIQNHERMQSQGGIASMMAETGMTPKQMRAQLDAMEADQS